MMNGFLFGCRNIAGFLRAEEVVGLVDAASALVLRDLRIRAERPRAVHLAVGRMGRQDGGGGFPLLAPLLERCQHVEYVRSLTASAMPHAGRIKQAHAV